MAGTSAARLTPDGLVSGGGLVDAWRQVARLHRAGIAHRALGLEQFSITADGQAVVEEFDGARVGRPPDDLARDTAQMLVATAVAVGVVAAVDAAVEAMGDEPGRAALPYLQPLALPGATPRALRRHKDVLATGPDPRGHRRGRGRDGQLERIRPRTQVSIVAFAVAFYVLLPQLADVQRHRGAAAGPSWRGADPGAAGVGATYLPSPAARVGSVPQPVPFGRSGCRSRRRSWPHRAGQHRRRWVMPPCSGGRVLRPTVACPSLGLFVCSVRPPEALHEGWTGPEKGWTAAICELPASGWFCL